MLVVPRDLGEHSHRYLSVPQYFLSLCRLAYIVCSTVVPFRGNIAFPPELCSPLAALSPELLLQCNRHRVWHDLFNRSTQHDMGILIY